MSIKNLDHKRQHANKKILKNTVTNNRFLKIIFKNYFFVKPSCPAAAVLQ